MIALDPADAACLDALCDTALMATWAALDGERVGAGPFRSAVVRDLPAPAAETPTSGRNAGDGASAPMLPARRARGNRRRERRSAISTGHAALFAVAMVATAVAAVALAEVDDHG